MRILSVNVGLPRTIEWQGRFVETAIFKEPVAGHVRVGRLNLDGDRQADLSVHGGAEKAIYVYPAEHYPFWRDELGEAELPWSAFGENFTSEGLTEDRVNVGDRFRIGSAEFTVTQPRMPCFKLGIRFGRADIVRRFLQSGRTGFYLAVTKEGEVGAGDAIVPISHQPDGVSIADVVSLYASDADRQDLLRRVSALPALPQGWRDYFRKRLWQPDE